MDFTIPEFLNSNGGNQTSGPLPPNYQPVKIEESGTITLNGFTYVFTSDSASINGNKINGIKLGSQNGVLMYYQGGGWIKLEGSDTQKLLEATVVKKIEVTTPQIPKPVDPVEQIVNTPVIKQVEQIVPQDRSVNVDHLTMQKFPERKTLFENPLLIFGLAAIGVAVFQLKN